MRTFTPLLLIAAVASAASAQSTSASTASLSSASGSSSSSMSAELAAIPECTTAQLNAAEETLTTNQREAQCEKALDLTSGTMLQVTTAEATEMCDTTSCKAALQQLYNAMPNCRYNLWGLRYSAEKLLLYCGITPENTTDSTSGSESVGWSVGSSLASSASADETPTPTTASSATSESSAVSASSSSSSSAATMTYVSAALAAATGLVAAFLA